MADVDIIEGLLNSGQELEFTTTGGDTRTLEYGGKDEKIVVVLFNDGTNDEDADVVFEAGDLFQKELGDITVTLDQDKYQFITFDSARVKDDDGEITIEIYDKGAETRLTDSEDIGIAVLEIA